MKKLIINLGQEAIVGMEYTYGGKTKKLDRVCQLDSCNFYNNLGTLDISQVVVALKKVVPKHLRGLDVDLILPSYVSDTTYVDAVFDDESADEPKKKVGKTVEKVVAIGENQTRKINQKIEYNTKAVYGIVNMFHRHNFNVVRAVTNASCYHNFVAAYNQHDLFGSTGGDVKTHINVVWGTTKTFYIISIGNLPVETRMSEFKLIDMYNDIVKSGYNIPFAHMLKIINNFELSQKASSGIVMTCSKTIIEDAGRSIEIPNEVIDFIKESFYSYMLDMVQEVHAIYDYVMQKYSGSSVYVCSNSIMLDECLCQTFNDFPINYIKPSSVLDVYNDKITLKAIPDLTDKYIPVIGCVIEYIKKGGDFYDV